jgi:hypothetical protein
MQGMLMLVLSATLPLIYTGPNILPDCMDTVSYQYIIFFGLYMVAIGHGGQNPCVTSFGADQFDDVGPDERRNARERPNTIRANSTQRELDTNTSGFCAAMKLQPFRVFLLSFIEGNHAGK